MNLKQITRQSLNRLVIALALLLVPTAVNSKTCEDKLGYPTAAVYNLVQSCFQYLNMNSIQNFGAPIIPVLGINQCVCITDKIRRKIKCVEEYMDLVVKDVVAEMLGEFSKQCILEGAMGDEARKAYIGGMDNSTKKIPLLEEVPTPKNDEVKNDQPKKENKNPITWDDLINK